jgi:oligopeptide/dipeptide ABC transporter ATP-binding protein
MTLLQVRELNVRFPHMAPVSDLSFSVDINQTVALVGESGSGKSLTALALLRLLPRGAQVTRGKVLFKGRDLLMLSHRDMRKLRGSEIAMIFQEPMTALNPVMTVGNQIGEVLRWHEGITMQAARARAVELLDLVRIPAAADRVDDYPHQFSGGMRQRVMIAMAVACRPQLLIADEPTTALDVTIQAQILELLDSLRRDLSMSMILVTHDLGVVAEWADRVVVMYAGRKVEEALPSELFATPLHPYTRGLLAASPRSRPDYHYRDGPLSEIPGNIISAQQANGCPFAPRCGLAQAPCHENLPQPIETNAGRLVACPIVGF